MGADAGRKADDVLADMEPQIHQVGCWGLVLMHLASCGDSIEPQALSVIGQTLSDLGRKLMETCEGRTGSAADESNPF